MPEEYSPYACKGMDCKDCPLFMNPENCGYWRYIQDRMEEGFYCQSVGIDVSQLD